MCARDARQAVQGSVARVGMCTGDQCNADRDPRAGHASAGLHELQVPAPGHVMFQRCVRTPWCVRVTPAAGHYDSRCAMLACASTDRQLLTFEHGADPPDAKAALTGKLPKGELHEEEGDAAKHEHDEVGEHEGT